MISKFEKDYIYKAIEISKLHDLRNDTISDFNFRLNHVDLIIDLYHDNFGVLNLKSTLFFIKKKDNEIKDTIINAKFYDTKIANWFYDKIISLKIEDKIPVISNNFGKSGVFMNDDYYLEFSNKIKYTIKAFSYPELDTISENYSLKNLIDELFEKIEIEKINQLQKGTKVAILSTGTIGNNVTKALSEIENMSLFSHYHFPFVKPLNIKEITNIITSHNYIITIEDGVITGGFGEQINSIMIRQNLQKPIKNLGIPDSFIEHGTVFELQQICKIDVTNLIQLFNTFQHD